MAEGWAKTLHHDLYESYSAGILTHGLNQRAVRVMNEQSIDISRHYSKTLDDLKEIEFDLVITVCDHASESCPIFPGRVRVIHHNFDDPPRLTQGIEDEELALVPYRRVRDEIEQFVRTLPELLK